MEKRNSDFLQQHMGKLDTRESQHFSLLAKLKKTPEIKGLWRFSIAKIDEKKGENFQLSIFGFQCLASNIEG